MSELGDQVTPTVELPPMRLPPRLLMDEVCFQVDHMQSTKVSHTDMLFRFR